MEKNQIQKKTEIPKAIFNCFLIVVFFHCFLCSVFSLFLWIKVDPPKGVKYYNNFKCGTRRHQKSSKLATRLLT